MRLLIVLLTVVATSVAVQEQRDYPRNDSTAELGADVSWVVKWPSMLNLSKLFNSVSKSVSSVPSFVRWLFSEEKFTEYDKSDLHDVELSQNAMQESADNRLLGEKGSSLTSKVSGAAIRGRQFFSATNAMTLAYESILQTVWCLASGEFTDPDLGTFALNATKYCDPKCGRIIPGVLCCSPMTPELLDVKLRLKIKGEPERLLNFRSPEDRKYLTAPGRVVFIVHGWIEKMSNMRWITDMREGFEDLDENAIIVDWRRGNAVHYWQAVANTRVVAAIIGRAILNWEVADRTLVVGFSLGGQIAGEAGQFTQKYGGVMINECHGLDPAGPFYDGASSDIMLDKSDCRLVQVIHTSAEDVRELSLVAVRFGTYTKSGHCDYWVNCGFNQGPCIDVDFTEMMKAWTRLARMSDGEMINYIANRACSHWRAPDIYTSSLRSRCNATGNPLVAHPCPNCGKGHFCVDKKNLLVANNTFPPFSQCSPDRDENYYVSSGFFEPFCPRK